MRTCTVTKEKFVPKNPDHFFSSVSAFNKFIRSNDPMDSFEPAEKREIQWTPQERIDPRTGERFMASHPAQIYAPSNEPVVERKNNPNDYFEPTEYDCAKCGQTFIRTKPAMKYCESCSDSGGKLVGNQE